ncbi:pyrophosphatase PpaX-like [Montipora capricornis]|uniref:pyrophosphatase PpaX-like n=1 Tax=Montipora capricornis TaxID=246305 RepID=UPI0035F1CCB1
MAVRGCTRRISNLLQVHTECGKQIHSKTQPTLTGIQTQVAWNERLGCGTSKEGRVVVVTDRTWQCADGYDYNKLFGPPLPTEQTTRTPSVKQHFVDRDLWRQGHVQKGNAPWARPLLPCFGSGSAQYSSLAGDGVNSSGSSNQMNPSLVIFDKDGTLIDVNTVWIPWMENHVRELEEATGLDLADEMYKEVGYCPKKQVYADGGLLAHATIAEIRQAFVAVLVRSGVSKESAQKLVSNCCKDFDSGGHDTLEPLGDLSSIFHNLKARGVKTAVCTTDSREGTLSALDRLGLMGMIDKVVCGDDKNIKPKPHPETALGICEALSVCPSQTVIIGDTMADTTMGNLAGLGMTIGVLSGAGNREFLEKEADVVLNNIDELLDTLYPNDS